MTFTPVINQTKASLGIFEFFAMTDDGEWLATVRIKKATGFGGFQTADGVWLSNVAAIRIAKFIAEKLDEK